LSSHCQEFVVAVGGKIRLALSSPLSWLECPDLDAEQTSEQEAHACEIAACFVRQEAE